MHCPTCFRDDAKDEAVWLIEADQSYWDGRYPDSRGFSKDVNDAVRFERREDAEKVRHWILQTWAFALRTTQHIWCNGSHRG